MKVSAGIVVTNGTHILLGHVTGYNHWDIPKGMVEPGEKYLEAAIRETGEEFGLAFRQNDLIDLGKFSYSNRKDLYLFKLILDELPVASSCICSSHFTSKKGEWLPEFDGFKIFPNEIGLLKIAPNMRKCFLKNNILDGV